jgi:unsaturated chondroitin disaccharide hydrolase
VDSFWSGQLWLAFDETQDPVFKQAAREQRPYFLERLTGLIRTLDLGFLYRFRWLPIIS